MLNRRDTAICHQQIKTVAAQIQTDVFAVVSASVLNLFMYRKLLLPIKKIQLFPA